MIHQAVLFSFNEINFKMSCFSIATVLRRTVLLTKATVCDAILLSKVGYSCKSMRCSSCTISEYKGARSPSSIAIKIGRYFTTLENPTVGTRSQESPYQLMKRIKDVELLTPFADSNSNLFSEQKWVRQFLANEISEYQLIEKTKKLEKKNNYRRDQSAKFTDVEVMNGTEQWMKDFIIGMGLCPYASGGFNSRKSIEVSQTTGLFIASEWIDLHAQHLIAEKEIVTKLLVFPNRPNYENFKEMCDLVFKSPVMAYLIENQLVKIAVFHPKALNPLYMEGEKGSEERN